jgi:hypothetical protein
MEHKAFQDKDGDWRVEAVDFDADGDVFISVFYGSDGQSRAEEYAAFKNEQVFAKAS